MALDRKLIYWCFERDNWRCRHCRDTSSLHPHHVIYKSHGGLDRLDNLITLCVQCHMEGIHAGNLDIEVLQLLEDDLRVKFIRKDGWKPK